MEIAGSPEPVLTLGEGLAKELAKFRCEKNLAHVWLCVVDVLTQTSVVLTDTKKANNLAQIAFNCGTDAVKSKSPIYVIQIGRYASRKKEFMPRLSSAIKDDLG